MSVVGLGALVKTIPKRWSTHRFVSVRFPSAWSIRHPATQHFREPVNAFFITRRLTRQLNSAIFMADSNASSVNPIYAEIIVVRHGETKWNADGRIQGHLDVELNDVGRQQATLVANRLARLPKISAIYSSDLKRASETAEIIAARCGRLEVIKDPDLRERHLGDLQGLLLRETAKVSPSAHKANRSRRTDVDIPGGGESLDKLYYRCTSALQRIGRKHAGEQVVVVTHGGVIRALHKRASPKKKLAGKILNTSINIFLLSDGDGWVIKAWGDVSHLDPTGYLESSFAE